MSHRLGLRTQQQMEGRAVLEPFATMMPGVFLYHSGRRQVMPKLRACIDHVKRHAQAAPAGVSGSDASGQLIA